MQTAPVSAGSVRTRKRVEHGAHQLLGAHDAVEIPAHRTERIVRGNGKIVRLLNLLQHRIGLAARVHVAGQNENRNVVRRRSRGRRNHIRRARADRRGDGHDLLALHMLGKCDGDVRHVPVRFCPDEPPRRAALLRKRLPEAYDVAVARQHEHAANERLLDIVIGDKLVLQKANQRLRHRQVESFSFGFLHPENMVVCIRLPEPFMLRIVDARLFPGVAGQMANAPHIAHRIARAPPPASGSRD